MCNSIVTKTMLIGLMLAHSSNTYTSSIITEHDGIDIQQLLAQVEAQPQQPRALFNRYALCWTSTIRTLQQFVAEQAGELAATCLFNSRSKSNRIRMSSMMEPIMRYTYFGLRYAQTMIGFTNLVDAIAAGLETEISTPSYEIHAKAFKDGLPYAATSAVAAFLSKAIMNLFYF